MGIMLPWYWLSLGALEFVVTPISSNRICTVPEDQTRVVSVGAEDRTIVVY